LRDRLRQLESAKNKEEVNVILWRDNLSKIAPYSLVFNKFDW
jgi:hypothetical protein